VNEDPGRGFEVAGANIDVDPGVTSQLVTAQSHDIELSGTGIHFLWSIAPTVITLAGSFFLLAYSVRRLGRIEYGAIVAIGGGISILTLFSTALRFAIVRSGSSVSKRKERTRFETEEDARHIQDIRAAHSLFIFGSISLVVVGVSFGWVIPFDLHLHGSETLHVYESTVLYVVSAALLFSVTSYNGILTSGEKFGLVGRITLVGFSVTAGLTLLLASPLKVVGLGLAAVGGAIVQALTLHWFGRRRAPWLSFVPHRIRRASLVPVLRYAGAIAILSATSTICSASDAFVIGAIDGGASVTIFRVGSTAPVALGGILMLSFGVLFPRLVQSGARDAQETAIGWIGRVVGWASGISFAALALMGANLVRLMLSRSDGHAALVLWVCSGAVCVDVAFHGVVQVIFARGEQRFLAKYSWIELTVNIAATIVGVKLYGPVGSAFALAATILVTDIVGFPLIMRGRWGSSPARFVWSNGLSQSILAGASVVAIGIFPIKYTNGFLVHIMLVGGDVLFVTFAGLLLVGANGRRRVLSLLRPTGSVSGSTS
jgi:O-antigen/teichoic acid export membrane protein